MLLQVKVVSELLCYLSGQKSKAVAGEMASSGRNSLKSRFSSRRWCSLNHLKTVYVSRNGVPEESIGRLVSLSPICRGHRLIAFPLCDLILHDFMCPSFLLAIGLFKGSVLNDIQVLGSRT